MKTLLWKDWHVNRAVLAWVGVVIVLPYLIGVVGNLLALWRYSRGESWPGLLISAGIFSLIFWIIGIALLGGNAVAGERADRSAEFLAYLPVSRRACIASKAAVALGAALLFWLFEWLVLYVLAPHIGNVSASELRNITSKRAEVVTAFVWISVLAFGAAWCASCFLRSPAFSACAGMAAPILLYAVLSVMRDALYDREPFELQSGFRCFCGPLGVLAFGVGTWYYVRRIEP